MGIRLTWYWSALGKRIATVTIPAGAGCQVINNLALGIDATGAHTGIDALQVATGLVCWTVRVDGAFRATVGIGITKVSTNAGACGTICLSFALSIRTTGWWEARVPGCLNWLGSEDLRDFVALAERVTLIANWTFANSNVVSWFTFCIESTGPTAGIQATLLDASLALGAFIIDKAFRPTVGWWALISSIAAAHRGLSKGLAWSKGPTGWWVARINRPSWWWSNNIRLPHTVSKWITIIIRWAGADRMVGDDLAAGINSTSARARINTALIKTGPVLGTIWADNTLRSTVGRSAKIASQACADTATTLHALVGKGTTKTVSTGVQFLCYCLFWWTAGALLKSITHKSRRAATHGHMVNDLTLGIATTGARARVNTFIVSAGLVTVTVWVENALWPTAKFWIAKKTRRTGADAAALLGRGNGTRTTGVWVAGIRSWSWRCNNI